MFGGDSTLRVPAVVPAVEYYLVVEQSYAVELPMDSMSMCSAIVHCISM